MDKTWRSRVLVQGRTRSGGPRLCADRSGAKNSTSFCGGRWIHGGLDVKAEERYKRGQVVSEFRRAVAWIIDIVVIMIPVAIFFAIDRARFINVIYDVRYVVCMALYITIVFSLITRITRGRTLGKALVNVKLVRDDDKNIGFFRLSARYLILYVVNLPMPVYAYNLYQAAANTEGWIRWLCVVGCVICIITAICFIIDFILCLFSDTRNMIYDRVTGITHVNMVR